MQKSFQREDLSRHERDGQRPVSTGVRDGCCYRTSIPTKDDDTMVFIILKQRIDMYKRDGAYCSDC